MATRSVLGIKAKLFLAFFVMAGLTILAAAIAWYAFVAIERSVQGITRDSVPAMAVSLRLAEKSAEIAATAPALMASANQDERISARSKLEGHSRELADLIDALNSTGIESRFDVLWGTDEMLLSALATGARGAVGSTYNYAAPLYLKIIAAVSER